ncbi:MAG: twin-arginine translocase TatA/TatE family subunit [Duncaniella sp.]|uniref:Sec-independent protein translocase subunit TatA/TatB n=1 Tax=Duncaniella sp. TaxID=2518496 RepID=UPI0023D39F1D|nr:twin-arginine translocase TatA/TatE family subunit [Duncaniella sp.]MDE6089922.1 twin-arginine translocase TatA/TatE family subunit [Duncaniella sp.]
MIPCFLNLGTGELIVIFLVIILLFGAKRIPELARSMGKGISMFKHGMNEAVTQINETPEADAKAKADSKPTTGEEEKK